MSIFEHGVAVFAEHLGALAFGGIGNSVVIGIGVDKIIEAVVVAVGGGQKGQARLDVIGNGVIVGVLVLAVGKGIIVGIDVATIVIIGDAVAIGVVGFEFVVLRFGDTHAALAFAHDAHRVGGRTRLPDDRADFARLGFRDAAVSRDARRGRARFVSAGRYRALAVEACALFARLI